MKKNLEALKYEIANELGLDNYRNMDKGSISSRINGHVGGQMVKHMIETYEKNMRG